MKFRNPKARFCLESNTVTCLSQWKFSLEHSGRSCWEGELCDICPCLLMFGVTMTLLSLVPQIRDQSLPPFRLKSTKSVKCSRLPSSSHLHMFLFGQSLQVVKLTSLHIVTVWIMATFLYNLFLCIQVFSLFGPPYCCKPAHANPLLKIPSMILHLLYNKIHIPWFRTRVKRAYL